MTRNGGNGIIVDSSQNTITGNTSQNNATLLFGFDLYDAHPDCDSNTWFGNIWGSAGFSPACTAAGGQGPAPAAANAAQAQPQQKSTTGATVFSRGKRLPPS